MSCFDQAAGQVGVPGVAVDDVDVVEHARHHQVAEHRVEELRVPRVLRGQRAPAARPRVTVRFPSRSPLVAEAEDLDGVAPALEPRRARG